MGSSGFAEEMIQKGWGDDEGCGVGWIRLGVGCVGCISRR